VESKKNARERERERGHSLYAKIAIREQCLRRAAVGVARIEADVADVVFAEDPREEALDSETVPTYKS
jgi:hypothetical protein